MNDFLECLYRIDWHTKHPQVPLLEQEGITDGIEMDIEALSTKEIAYHMTLFDWDLFLAVHEFELLYQTFGKHLFGKVVIFIQSKRIIYHMDTNNFMFLQP